MCLPPCPFCFFFPSNPVHTPPISGKDFLVHRRLWKEQLIPTCTNKRTYPPKQSYTRVHVSVVGNTLKLETAHVPIHRKARIKDPGAFIQWSTTRQHKGRTTAKQNNLDGFQRHDIKIRDSRHRGVYTLWLHDVKFQSGPNWSVPRQSERWIWRWELLIGKGCQVGLQEHENRNNLLSRSGWWLCVCTYAKIHWPVHFAVY